MGVQLRIFLSICALLFFVATLYYIRCKGLDLYRTILWFSGAAVLLILAIFPKPVIALASLSGVETPSNFVFLVLIGFLLFLALSMSASISRQHGRIKNLVQSVAILENRLEELEKQKPQNCNEKNKGKETDQQSGRECMTK